MKVFHLNSVDIRDISAAKTLIYQKPKNIKITNESFAKPSSYHQSENIGSFP